MTLQDPKIPITYRDRKNLYARDLTAQTRAVEAAFAVNNLNFTQLKKDLFISSYDYTNNGAAHNATSLEERINNLSSGGSPISGSSSGTFGINTSGNAATLTTVNLTNSRTFSFPDADGVFVLQDAAQTLTNKSLTSPAITGTVSGGATYSSITLTSPTITGTVSGGATYSSITLTTPTIASFTNAQHNHSDAANGGTLPASSIASGTFADARIASSNVTQHQASIAIAASQVTTGILAVARGGTGVATSTGTGDTVRNNNPNILLSTGATLNGHTHDSRILGLTENGMSYSTAASTSNFGIGTGQTPEAEWFLSRDGTIDGRIYFMTGGDYWRLITQNAGSTLTIIDNNTGAASQVVSSLVHVSGNEYYYQISGSPDLRAYTVAQSARFVHNNAMCSYNLGVTGFSNQNTTRFRIFVQDVASTDTFSLTVTSYTADDYVFSSIRSLSMTGGSYTSDNAIRLGPPVFGTGISTSNWTIGVTLSASATDIIEVEIEVVVIPVATKVPN